MTTLREYIDFYLQYNSEASYDKGMFVVGVFIIFLLLYLLALRVTDIADNLPLVVSVLMIPSIIALGFLYNYGFNYGKKEIQAIEGITELLVDSTADLAVDLNSLDIISCDDFEGCVELIDITTEEPGIKIDEEQLKGINRNKEVTVSIPTMGEDEYKDLVDNGLGYLIFKQTKIEQ